MSRFALRFYVLGIVQFLIVVAAMEATRKLEERPLFGERQSTYVVEDLARVYDDPARLQAEVDRAAKTLLWNMDVRDEAGRVVAHAVPATTPERAPLRRATKRLPLQGGRVATLDFEVHPYGPPPGMRFRTLVLVVLVVLGITAFVAARSVTRPLAQLSELARSFGAGKLDARARMRRKDEIGEVARAFDDMADRIARLLLAERELLANVSHELRTPLARIRVALDLANEAEPRVAVESLGDIAEDLAELERIVDDVLAAARLAYEDAGGPVSSLPVRKEQVAIRTLLEKSAAKFQAHHPGRALDLSLADDLPAIRGDAVLVRRVVDNLLDNAHKYSKAPGDRVALRARGDGGQVVIEVEDHGQGIAAADLERVFEPFFRADRSRTRSTGGLGLGLALARRVVEAHGGTIAMESTVGAGTLARVTLPAAGASRA